MLTSATLVRASAIAIAALLVFAGFQVRGLAGPRLVRMALAPIPGAGVITYDYSRNDLATVTAGGSDPRSRVSLALSISADGDRVVVGTEDQLLISQDGGRTLAPALHDIHMWATALRGDDVAAVSWGRTLFVSHDGGRTWREAVAPVSDLQVNALLITEHAWLAASQVGLLVSHDAGASWTLASNAPDRETSLVEDSGRILLGTWSGGVYASADDGDSWQLVHTYPSGVWALAPGSLVGTATGLFVDGVRAPGALGATEIVSVAVSGQTRFAAAPGSRVWADDGGGWHQVLAGVRW